MGMMEEQYRIFARESIKRHEGFRDSVYLDSLGLPTVGWGTHLYEGRKIPVEVLETLFAADFEQAIRDAQVFAGGAWCEMTERQRAALTDMAYNLGAARLGSFKNMQQHLHRLEFDDAAEHILTSKYAKQVGHRATRIAKWMREG